MSHMNELQAMQALVVNFGRRASFREERSREALADVQEQLLATEVHLHDTLVLEQASRQQLGVANSKIAALEVSGGAPKPQTCDMYFYAISDRVGTSHQKD